MKRLKTLGVIVLLLAGASAILPELGSGLVFMETVSDQEVVSCLIGGVGLFLVLLGAVIGPSPYRPNTPGSANGKSRQPARGAAGSLQHKNRNFIPVTCPNCQKNFRSGARFCTRCGTPAPAATPVPELIPAPPLRSMPPMHTASPRHVRRVSWAYRMLFFILMSALWIIGGVVVYKWRSSGHMRWSHHFQPTPAPTMVLPTAPRPGDTPNLPVGALRQASIQQAWMAPEYVVAADGSVGLNAIASIYVASPAPSGLKFVVHFLTSDARAISSADPAFADPNGQIASSTMILPGATHVQAFIPISAFDDISSGHMQMQPSIFDTSNHLVQAISPISFTLRRSAVYITHIALESPAGANTTRTLKVNISATEDRPQIISGRVIVNFKAPNGQMIRGRGDFVNSQLELTMSAQFIVESGSIPVRIKDMAINIPPSTIPPNTTAEVSLIYNESKRTIQTDQIAVLLP